MPPSLPESSAILCFLLILLVPLAMVGLVLTNAGLGRSRSAAHAVMASLCAFGAAVIAYLVIGFSWQGTTVRGAAYHVAIGGRAWDWRAAQPFFLRGVRFDLSVESLIVLLQVFSVGLAAVIPLSAGSDRWRLGASCASSALLAGITYPLFAHWVWGGGWLAQLGDNAGLGRGFIDGAGASTIQAVGGLTALAIAWILGPRRGKFSDRVPIAIPGHNAVLALAGCAIAGVGWLGLNSAGAILLAAVGISSVVLIALNTVLCAVASGLTAAVITRIRFGKPDASLTANGWMAGLVASSAAAAFLKPAAAILVGIIAGALVLAAIDLMESRLAIDDPCGAVAVHAVGGIWGLLTVFLLANESSPNQWLAQLAGIATLLGFVLPLTYALNWILNYFYPQRVDEEGEQQGMDLHELGAGAYPEFMVHRDDFSQR